MPDLSSPLAIAAEAGWHAAMLAFVRAQAAVQERRTRETLAARREAAAVLQTAREWYLEVTGQTTEERVDV